MGCGGSTPQPTDLTSAIMAGDSNAAARFAADTEQEQLNAALALACRTGDEAVCTALLDAGAALETSEADGSTPILVAVKYAPDPGPVVMLLVDAGALLSAVDQKGTTALHAAAQRGLYSTVAFLTSTMEEEAVSATDAEGRTAADVARSAGHEECAAQLLPL